MSTPASPTPGLPWRAIALSAYGPTLLASAAASAVYPVMAMRAQQVGATLGQAAFILALAGIAQLLCAVPAGALVARVGERTAMIWAGILDVAAFAIAGVAPNLWVLGAVTFAAGAGSSVYWLARQTFLVQTIPATHTARAMSTLGGTLRVGAFLGPLISGPVIGRWGIQAAYVVAVLFALGALTLVVRAADITGVPARPEGQAPTRTMEVLREHSGVLLTIGVGMVGLAGLRELRTIAMPLWGAHVNLDGSTLAGIFALAAAVEMLLFYPAGYLMDRWGRVFVAVVVPLSIGLSLIALPWTSSAHAMALIALVTAVGNGLGSGIVMTLGADLSPQRDRTQFLAGWRLCSEIGRGGLPVAFSALAASLSLAAACIATGAIGLLAALWLAYFLGRWKRPTLPVGNSEM